MLEKKNDFHQYMIFNKFHPIKALLVFFAFYKEQPYKIMQASKQEKTINTKFRISSYCDKP